MKTLRICKHRHVCKELSVAEEEALAKAFSRASKPVSAIVQYLEQEIIRVDNTLNNTEALYDKARADLYTAGLLAERAALMKLHKLLTNVDQTQSEI